ncbi:efflux transporter outer membrane subunit [Propionivibrio limicola]|uniref:efflux transporter outer membrane subunit n=1 Tax=Propionivibrio limicola TaxID=167645 RepID=UPI001290AC18|nr:efflux transporter outer membrane subunit [Propionivibrio limicola]
MRPLAIVTPLICFTLLAGCANLAPDYARPHMPVPATIDGKSVSAQTVEGLDWQRVVTEDRLRKTVELALANNRDLRIAALNIEKARAQYQIQDAALYPAINATVGGSSSRYEGAINRKYSAGLGITSYELDFFGRLSNLSESALQSFLTTEATQRSVRTSLIAEVTSAWLTLAATQDLLKLAQETLESRTKTLELTRKQLALGGVSRLAVAQAQATTEAARGDVANYTSLVEQARNALNLLAGTVVPDDLRPAATNSVGQSALALLEVPAGLSSEQLLQRPDIVAAEHSLIASHADIGAARAAFFPSITLTGSAGSASSSLNQLFDAGTRAWAFAPTLTLPIFNAGALRASLSVAETSRDIQVATYEKTVQTAFREVADALAERSTLNERMEAQKAEVDAYATSLRLSTERYRSGADSYLNVLDSQRSLYTAQKSLISLQLSEQTNRMTLFKVLGGE